MNITKVTEITEVIHDICTEHFGFEMVCCSQTLGVVEFSHSEERDTAVDVKVLNREYDVSYELNDINRAYNPAVRGYAHCTYVHQESDMGEVLKFCVIQHKGNTHFEIHKAEPKELIDLFFGPARDAQVRQSMNQR